MLTRLRLSSRPIWQRVHERCDDAPILECRQPMTGEADQNSAGLNPGPTPARPAGQPQGAMRWSLTRISTGAGATAAAACSVSASVELSRKAVCKPETTTTTQRSAERVLAGTSEKPSATTC